MSAARAARNRALGARRFLCLLASRARTPSSGSGRSDSRRYGGATPLRSVQDPRRRRQQEILFDSSRNGFPVAIVDHALCEQRRNVILAVTERLQHLGGILPEPG